MQIREYSLPAGWFPRDSGEVSRFLGDFKQNRPFSGAAISPHAGWYYCGRLAAMGVASLDPDADTVVVLGGHLSSGSSPLLAMEDAVRTPFGTLSIDTEFRSVLKKALRAEEDRYRDNTIEVLLPMVHYFFPKSKLLWLRLPAEIASFAAGKTISQQAVKLGRKINVLGSTDLTHYGQNYGFSPKGSGIAALNWMRDVNDASFIKAVEAGDCEKALTLAQRDYSSCSAGAVLGAMGFAEEEGLDKARLLEYGTSADIDDDVPSSFVGYASFAFDKVKK